MYKFGVLHKYPGIIWVTYLLFVVVIGGVCLLFLSLAVVLALETSILISPETGAILFLLYLYENVLFS